MSLNHPSYINWNFYPLVWDMFHVVNNANISIEIHINVLDADHEPPLAREGIHASRIVMFLGVVMLLVALLGGCELGTVKFVLVLTPTDSFSRST